jgi:4,5-dihydroxyphthalate decarboxylase
MTALQLSFGLSSNPRTWPIIQGRVKPEGVDPVVTVLHPSELFWRQLKFHEFDVSEMSMSTFMRATARGDTDFVAIPVFTTRHFFHADMLVRADAGIDKPADLKGKRVGVPEYQQTAALWVRGVLQHEFGVAPPDMEFWMERTPEVSHGSAGGFAKPKGVTIHQIPAEESIGSMMLAGTLDATLFYLTDRNLVDRSRADLSADPRIKTLFPDPLAEGVRYFRKTGIFPINHLTVIRRSLFERHPWLALNVYRAFAEANALCQADRVAQAAYHVETGLLPAAATEALKQQVLEHGIRANRLIVETAAAYSHEQQLTPRPLSVAELFAPATLEL